MRLDSFLSTLLSGRSLSLRQSQLIFSALLKKKIPMAQGKSILLLLARKGETADEVLGCSKALRTLESIILTKEKNVIDTSGTGGDRSGSLNVSTLAAFVIAGAGGHVAKHGNRSSTSKCGSSDLLEALGVRLDAPAEKMRESLEKAGIGYFHAPYYHPALTPLQPLRRSLRTRTIFNLIGPLANPVKTQCQITGVSSLRDFKVLSEVLRKSGRRACVVMSLDGLDELSPGSKNRIAYLENYKKKVVVFDPKKYGFKLCSKRKFRGGTPRRNARIVLHILQNRLRGPMYQIVILNAALGLTLLEPLKSFQAALKQAEMSIQSGKAYRALQSLIKFSREGINHDS